MTTVRLIWLILASCFIIGREDEIKLKVGKAKLKIVVLVIFGVAALSLLAGWFLWKKGGEAGGWEMKADKEDHSRFEVWVDSGKKAANAVQIDLSYNPDEIEKLDFDKNNSVCELWVYDTPKIEKPGLISIACGKPTPGFSGRQYVGAFSIKAKQKAEVAIAPSSQILLNDGQGTALPFKPTKFIIEP